MHGFEGRLAQEPSISVSTVLKLVGQAYRNVRRQGGSRIDAELAALESYGTLRPDVRDVEARRDPHQGLVRGGANLDRELDDPLHSPSDRRS